MKGKNGIVIFWENIINIQIRLFSIILIKNKMNLRLINKEKNLRRLLKKECMINIIKLKLQIFPRMGQK